MHISASKYSAGVLQKNKVVLKHGLQAVKCILTCQAFEQTLYFCTEMKLSSAEMCALLLKHRTSVLEHIIIEVRKYRTSSMVHVMYSGEAFEW